MIQVMVTYDKVEKGQADAVANFIKSAFEMNEIKIVSKNMSDLTVDDTGNSLKEIYENDKEVNVVLCPVHNEVL